MFAVTELVVSRCANMKKSQPQQFPYEDALEDSVAGHIRLNVRWPELNRAELAGRFGWSAFQSLYTNVMPPPVIDGCMFLILVNPGINHWKLRR